MALEETFTCPICGHTEYEKKKPFRRFLQDTFLILLLVTSIVGTLGVYSFAHSRLMLDKESVFGIGGFGAVFLEATAGQSNMTWLREIAVNLSQNCTSDDCKARKIYEHIIPYYPEYAAGYFYTDQNKTWVLLEKQDLPFRYKDSTDYNLSHIWERKEGDCDTLAYFYLQLLKSIGIDGNLQCGNEHCWAIVKLKDRTIIADITKLDFIEKRKWFGMVNQEDD